VPSEKDDGESGGKIMHFFKLGKRGKSCIEMYDHDVIKKGEVGRF
jgi:hypothetical protein